MLKLKEDQYPQEFLNVMQFSIYMGIKYYNFRIKSYKHLYNTTPFLFSQIKERFEKKRLRYNFLFRICTCTCKPIFNDTNQLIRFHIQRLQKLGNGLCQYKVHKLNMD